jgi:zinc transport system substrate-binding protein
MQYYCVNEILLGVMRKSWCFAKGVKAMRILRWVGVAALVGCLAWLVACGQEKPVADGPTVVVSIEPQAWLVEQLGGSHVKVVTLVRPGESPATYQPSDAQVSQAMQASVYFRIGVPFEEGKWFDALAKSSSLHVVDTRQNITLRTMEAHHHEAGTAAEHGAHEEHSAAARDPHIWLTPRLLRIQAQTMADALIAVDPGHQDIYRSNLLALKGKLDETDAEIRRKLQSSSQRTFFVFHPSWGYFADEYGLKQMALELEGKEPSDAELTAFQKLARELNVKTIFVQPQISGHSARALAEAIGGRVVLLDPLARDVSKNLLDVATAIAESSSPARSQP